MIKLINMKDKQLNEIKKNKMIYECQSFYTASKKLIDNKSEDITFSCDMIPCAVNCALTSELALKSLYLILDLDYKNIHNLDELLFGLPQDYQIGILYNFWKNYYRDFDCEFVINKVFSISEYFVHIRYLSDYSQLINLYDIQSFMEVVYQFVSSKYKIQTSRISKLDGKCPEAIEIDKKFIEAEQQIINERKLKLSQTKKSKSNKQ